MQERSGASLDRACRHEEFGAFIEVVRLEDSGLFQANIRIECADCGDSMVFPDEIPIGVDLGGIARSVDGVELRVAVRSEFEARAPRP
jgi:hypothetical protein